MFDVLAMYESVTQRAEITEDIFSQPVKQHLSNFASSHSVITIIHILSQTQGTSRHKPWR
ncbi:type II toxin-antitoxin system RelE/ParE family toxin [Cronobacter turicensis]|nr:type II toxin-antitoxin system RelE/ParE family toxin [Cronobacter turicensis]